MTNANYQQVLPEINSAKCVFASVTSVLGKNQSTLEFCFLSPNRFFFPSKSLCEIILYDFYYHFPDLQSTDKSGKPSEFTTQNHRACVCKWTQLKMTTLIRADSHGNCGVLIANSLDAAYIWIFFWNTNTLSDWRLNQSFVCGQNLHSNFHGWGQNRINY